MCGQILTFITFPVWFVALYITVAPTAKVDRRFISLLHDICMCTHAHTHTCPQIARMCTHMLATKLDLEGSWSSRLDVSEQKRESAYLERVRFGCAIVLMFECLALLASNTNPWAGETLSEQRHSMRWAWKTSATRFACSLSAMGPCDGPFFKSFRADDRQEAAGRAVTQGNRPMVSNTSVV